MTLIACNVNQKDFELELKRTTRIEPFEAVVALTYRS